jgi:tripartite-type tricarboxylate transporter receptor subunit TctC
MRLKGLALAVAAAISHGAAQADEAQFFQGKSINLIVGYGPGGGYDIFARVFARFMPNHVPGKPGMVVQNMPGASSLRATNHLYVNAPKDGTVIAAFDRNMPLIALLGGNPNVQFDPLKLTWLGTLSDSTDDSFTLIIRKRPDIRSIGDLRKAGGPQITVGVTNPGATDHDVTVLLKEVLGLNIRVVGGYQDSNTVALAVERGELDGQFVNFVSTKAARPAWIDPKGAMQTLLQFARKTRHAELPDVPTALEIARDDAARQMIQLAEIPYLVARPYAAPPNLTPERARILQDAFIKTARDSEFVAEAKKLNLEVSPLDAKETLAVIERLAQIPQAQRNRLREIMYSSTKN